MGSGLGEYSRKSRGSHAPRDMRTQDPTEYRALGQAAAGADKLMGAGPAAMINRAIVKATASPERLAVIEARAKKARKP